MAAPETPWVAAVAVLIVVAANLVTWAINGAVQRRVCRCARPRALLVLTNWRAHPARAASTSLLAWDLIDTSDLYCAGMLPPLALALYRLLCLGVWVFVIVYGAVLYSEAGMEAFTNWTFVLWGALCVLSSALTFQAWWQRRRREALPVGARDGEKAVSAGAWVWAQRVHLLTLAALAPASLTLTAFYWAVEFKPDGELRLTNPFKHGVSALLLLLDVFLSRAPLASYHAAAPMLYGSLYEVFMWIYASATGDWPYDSLNWNKPASLIYYAVLPVLIIITFVIVMLVAGLRELLLTGKCCVRCACCGCRSCRLEGDVDDGGLEAGGATGAAPLVQPGSQTSTAVVPMVEMTRGAKG